MEQDVVAALHGLGCAKRQAEAAVRSIKNEGAPQDFEIYLRAAITRVK
jgi:hypothetical protein